MKSFIEKHIGRAIEYLKHGSQPEQPAEPAVEPKPEPYQKKFMEASKTLFDIARKLREINETISLYKTYEDLSMEDLRKVCSLYYDLKFMNFEPFDILIEEAHVEAGDKSLIGVMRLLGIEIKTFRSNYRYNVDWYNRQCSFEFLYERIARERYTTGPERIEKAMAEYIAAQKEFAFYHYLSEAHFNRDGLSDEENEKRYEFCRDKILEISKHPLVSKDREYIKEQEEKFGRNLFHASNVLREEILKCYFFSKDFREEFKGITFDIFYKIYDLCNRFSVEVNQFKCNSSGELPEDGNLYFTEILKPLYEKCNGVIFEPADMRDYLEILNICVSQKTLKIKENKIGYACAVIYALYTHSSEDRSYLDGWESRIVDKLKIDPSTYKQRKSDIKNGQASESLLGFYNGLTKILTIRN